MSKILTIVVPSYNMEAYLGKCLDSLILKNTEGIVDGNLMQSLEVLIINDGSKDRTSKIGHSYQERYPDIFRVIDKENGHYGSCVNRGLAEATGTYIRVLDADDYVDNAKFKGFLELLLSFEPDKLPDAVLTDFDYVDTDGKLIVSMHLCLTHGEAYLEPSDAEKLEHYCFQTHSLTYLTRIPRSMEYTQTEGVLYTDTEWFILPMVYVKKYFYYPESVVKYLIGREGQSVSKEVMCENFNSLLSLAFNIVVKLEKLIENNAGEGGAFPKARILQLIKNQYNHVIFDGFCDERCINLLKKFDMRLKENFPVYYDELTSSNRRWHFFTLYYIAEWRKGYTVATQKFLIYKMLVAVGNFIHRLKRWFQHKHK